MIIKRHLLQRRHNEIPIRLRVRIDAMIFSTLLLRGFGAVLPAIQTRDGGARADELVVGEHDAHILGDGGDGEGGVEH